jgi:tetratricopeptide (TPR) repeat protein
MLAMIALAQGQLEEGERLIASISSFLEAEDRPFYRALELYRMGVARVLQGRYEEAQAWLEKSEALRLELGIQLRSIESNAWLGMSEVHLGRYESARSRAQATLDIARQDGVQWGIAFSLLVLAALALIDGAYEEAQRLAHECATLSRAAGMPSNQGWAAACLGFAARGRGDPVQAQTCFCEALQVAIEVQAFVPLAHALSGIALLLADQGQVERAGELYALASRHPLVANSRWFEEVAGRHIAAAAQTLPPDVAAAARERGRASDLWATARELLAELGQDVG